MIIMQWIGDCHIASCCKGSHLIFTCNLVHACKSSYSNNVNMNILCTWTTICFAWWSFNCCECEQHVHVHIHEYITMYDTNILMNIHIYNCSSQQMRFEKQLLFFFIILNLPLSWQQQSLWCVASSITRCYPSSTYIHIFCTSKYFPPPKFQNFQKYSKKMKIHSLQATSPIKPNSRTLSSNQIDQTWTRPSRLSCKQALVPTNPKKK